jgi:hypothetical protein
MDDKFLSLPWEIQIALGSGYLAYALAYLGIRDHHKPIDTAFRAVAFGLCATSVLAIIPADLGFWRIAAAVLVSLVSGFLWRYWIADGVQWLIRKADLSWSDETPSAWSKITLHNSRTYVSQISVQLDDDSWLFCTDTRPFSDSPYGPCVLGPTGDVALYVTHKCGPGEEIVEDTAVRDPHHGSLLTYVPANRIRKVTLRMLNGSKSSVAGAEVLPPVVEAAP